MLKAKTTMKGKSPLIQSKGLNVSVYKVHGSGLIDLVIMCIFWDRQLKAERKTQPPSALVVYTLVSHEPQGEWINQNEVQRARTKTSGVDSSPYVCPYLRF